MQRDKLKKIADQILEAVSSFKKKNEKNKKKLTVLKTKISKRNDQKKVEGIKNKISQL